jgi:hypothetical protein
MLLENVFFFISQGMLTVLPRMVVLVLGRLIALLVTLALIFLFLQLLDIDTHDLLPKLLLG